MRITLTLHELSRSRVGQEMGTGPIMEYGVGGLPAGEEAFIANFGSCYQDRWRILRAKGDVDTGWTGNYTNANAALTDLQRLY